MKWKLNWGVKWKAVIITREIFQCKECRAYNVLLVKVAQEFETAVSIFDEFTDFFYIISYMTRNIILGYNKVHFGWGINFGFFGKCGNFEGF